MKKTITKRIIVGISILFLIMGSFLIYAVDIISIDPDRFIATLRIQQINLYYRMTSPTRMVGEDYVEKYDIVKVGLKNVGVNSGVLYIRPVDANDEFIDEIHNEIMDRERASIIGGHDNTNNGDETSFILGGSRNTVEGHGTVQIGGEGNVSSVENAVILGSANSSVETPNGVVMASDGGVVKGRDSTKIGGGGTIDESAYNSFAIAGGTDISAPGVFAVGDITAKRPNIVQLNLGQGLIVGGRKFNGSKKIQLSVHGALAVGIGQCTTNMKGAIYYVPAIASNGNPAYCLCACVTDTSEDAPVGAVTGQALSNQPYCDPVCWGEGVLGQPQCGTRGFSSGHMVYEYGETEWRRGTNFCKDNYVPHDEYGNEPEFPERGGVTIWTCPGVAEGEEVECKAYRKKDPPQPAVCGRNAARYSYKSERFYGELASDYCVWNSLNGDNLSENGRPHAYKVLTAQQVKDKEEVEYTTGLLWTEAVRQLNNSFPATGGRTYWICETTNSDNATVQGAETVMQKECFAERMDCNYCAKDGFPYCFDIDFSDECGTGTRGPCREGTDNSCREPLYRNWNQTEHSDSLYSAWATFTKVEIKDGWITGVVYNTGHNMFEYYMLPNLTSQIRTGVVHMEATDPSYCKSWDVCIVQCPYEYYWDGGSMSCKKVRPQNAIVNFHCNGGVAHMDNGTAVGELMGSQEFATGVAKKLKKNNCTKDGYFFVGWSTNSGAKDPEWGDEEERTFLEPVTEWLYAVWERDTRYTVKFDCGDKADSEQKMEDQIMRAGVREKLHKSICTDTGYVTIGWNKKSGQVVAEYGDEEEVVDLTGVGGTITLYAAWQRLNEVYYNCNGGEGYTEEQYYKSGESKALSENGCSRAGYSFSGWNTNAAGTGTNYKSGQIIKFDGWGKKLFLYAQWKKDEACKIKFHCNGEGGTMEDQEYETGKAVKLNKSACLSNTYSYLGWNTGSSAKVATIKDEATIKINTCGIDLYAVRTGAGCDMSNFGYKEITIKNNKDPSKTIVIMDRNLGATSVGTGCNEDNLGPCGCMFQWGNNYGFPSYGLINTTTVDKTKVDATKYGPTNPYKSGTYIRAPTVNINLTNNGDWAYKQNDNLWGGGTDNATNNYFSVMTNASSKDRRGPCPEGWHVPSQGELSNLVSSWISYYTGTLNASVGNNCSCNLNGGRCSCSIPTTTYPNNNFLEKFKIPKAGYRLVNNSGFSYVNSFRNNAQLWSSSKGGIERNGGVLSVGISYGSDGGTNYSINTNYDVKRHYAQPIRCFKDTQNPTQSHACTGDIPKHSKAANNKERDGLLSSDAERLVYTGADLQKDCAYECESGYTYLKANGIGFCASCRPDTIIDVEHGYCVASGTIECPGKTRWFDGMGCRLPGTCTYFDSNRNETIEFMEPVSPHDNKAKDSTCIDDSSLVVPYSCQYSCKPGYICGVDYYGGTKKCIEPKCYSYTRWDDTYGIVVEGTLEGDKIPITYPKKYQDLYSSLLLGREKIYYRFGYNGASYPHLYTAKTIQRPTLAREDWLFVTAENQSEFENKVKGLSGCFYWCTGDDLTIYQEEGRSSTEYRCGLGKPTTPGDNPGGGSEPGGGGYTPTEQEKDICTPSTLGVWGPHDISFSKGLKSKYPNLISWTWHLDGSTNYVDPCHIWCTNLTERKILHGNYYCWAKCASNEYLDTSYGCSPCIPPQYPDPLILDDFGENPMGCYTQCTGYQYSYDESTCRDCQYGWKPNLNDKDRHGNPKSCYEVCTDQNFSYRKGEERCGEGVDECCLEINPGATSKCAIPDSDCNWVVGMCICPLDDD